MERILTTHTGSLTRPPEILAFLNAIDDGAPYDEDAHAECLRQCVADVVHQQSDVGIDIVSDGEFGKVNWISYLFERISGLELGELSPDATVMPASRDRQAFPEFYAELDAQFLGRSRLVQFLGARGVGTAAPKRAPSGPEVWLCTGPIEYEGEEALQRDIDNLKAALQEVEVTEGFLPVVAPGSVFWLHNRYYETDEEFAFALADALRTEYRAIVDSGLLLQVDDAVLVHEYDSILSRGGSVEDYRRWAQVRVDALNHALEGIPEDRVRYHICWGSWNGPHAFDPPLADVVDLILQVRARYYSIEQAGARHEHEWRLWEDVKLPEGKVLVPGVVTHHTHVIEHPELICERLVRLAKLVGRENVIGSTDCGFAGGAYVRRFHPSIQWAKLQALADGAELASRQLWGPAAERV